MTRTYKTNLRCSACEEKIRPSFDAEPSIERWHVDLTNSDKLLSVEGDAPPARVAQLLERAGYRALGEHVNEPTAETAANGDYFPLVLIVLYILGVVALVEWNHGSFAFGRAMTNFMAGFFLVFSFFKLLNLPAFADGYSGYDLLAARSRAYALAYPFIELALGVAYLVRFQPTATNVVTLALMTVGLIGVAKTLLARRRIQCACLGAVFNLPMSSVTLIEDLSMAAMAAAMLLFPSLHG